MLFDLSSLTPVRVNLDSLVAPIPKEEIDRVIKFMPTDKTAGPDGFNGLFIKKCWNIIKGDFYKLCQDFFDCEINLDSLNESFITLETKINSLESVNDFRPISLLNNSIKLLTNKNSC
jgi:hypothetical protein